MKGLRGLGQQKMNGEDIAAAALAQARNAGATQADVVLIDSLSKSISCRLGKQESLERSSSTGIGLRVFVGQRQAITSSSDFSPQSLALLAERSVAMARHSTDDPYSALAPEDRLIKGVIPDLDLYDPVEPKAEAMERMVLEAEEAALAVKGITNSEGADAYYGTYQLTLATSAGFMASQAASSVSLAVSVLAGEGEHMERDYDYASARHWADLSDPAALGRKAAALTLRRLNPAKAHSKQLPVVFDPRVGRGLIGAFGSSISGSAVARGTSFLKKRMGEQVFAKGIAIIDDPLRKRGLSSRAFDAEGVVTTRHPVVEDGVLTSWLLDVRSAAQLGLETTGHAGRGLANAPYPSVSNFYLAAGRIAPEAMIGEIDEGFYVTEVFGMGVNTVTGDYSQGASGLWIEKGELTYPVSGATIAGNLNDMFARMTAASDLVFRYGSNVPTLRIDGMTVAGG